MEKWNRPQRDMDVCKRLHIYKLKKAELMINKKFWEEIIVSSP
jgi:hypothetical protein